MKLKGQVVITNSVKTLVSLESARFEVLTVALMKICSVLALGDLLLGE
jgi:hypothetical protein